MTRMAAPLPRARMTAEDLFVLPDDGYRYELTGGELVRGVSMRPVPASS